MDEGHLRLDTPVYFQERKSVEAADLTLEGTIYRVKDQAGNLTTARGVRIVPTLTGSADLEVHLLDDYDSSGDKAYTVYSFAGGEKEGMMFDEIRSTNTTITLADVKILLN